MHEKPPGEALVEMDSLEPGSSRRPNGAAAVALIGGILVAILGLLLVASKPRDPLPPPWWYALLVLSGITTLLALLGWAKSGAPNTAGRKRSVSALVLGLAGIIVTFTVGKSVFIPTPQPTPKRIGTSTTRRAGSTRTAGSAVETP